MLAHNTARTQDRAAVDPAPAATPGAKPKPNTKPIVVESRFGPLEIRPEDCLTLPGGLLGFGEFHDFALTAVPGDRHPQFRVLQCLTSPDLAFLVAPLNLDSEAIAADDLAEACATYEIARENLVVLLIVTVRRDDKGAHVSVNMRAPLLVDTAKHVARQYVLSDNRYSIRHAL